MRPSTPNAAQRSRRPELILVILFVISLPLLNPWVRGDGVGYYALARAPLIQHNLDFTADYQHANAGFREPRLDENGHPRDDFRTATGHLDNHFTIGPAILWSPFLIAAHAGVHIARAFGSSVVANGFSVPYRVAMAFATSLYGFLSLLISFRVARKFVEERWALLATLGVWGSTSLALYMYFNPSWSHAHSAFVVALYYWYWLRTRENRSLWQWIVLGAIVGLMLNVYYANATLLAILVAEAVPAYVASLRDPAKRSFVPRLFTRHLVFIVVVAACMLPTFITRAVIYGSATETGYIPVDQWLWFSPYLLQVLFSSNHGLIAWTPLVALSFVGLIFFWRQEPKIGGPTLLGTLAFYYFIASYPDWAGISSYGNRFFVSLTVFFVFGLGIFLEKAASLFKQPQVAFRISSLIVALLFLWNAGLMFQWGSHLIPARGPIAWAVIVRNQFTEVPRRGSGEFLDYFFHRKELMKRIEQRDAEQRKRQSLSD